MSGLPDGPLPHRLDDGAPRRAALGLVVLSADETLEADLRLLLPDPAVRLYHTRIASAPEVSAASLGDMEGRLQAAAALLPASAGLDAIGYACTSAATVLGSARVAERVRAAHPGVPVSDPLCALIAACRALGVRRLGLVSPYVAEVSDALRRALAEAGVAVAAFASFERAQERAVARIAPDSIRSALERVGRSPDCEAVFASCTNLRALAVIEDAERALGKPVLASNTVLAWHLARLAGLPERLPGAGQLGTHPLLASAHNTFNPPAA